MQQRTHLGVSPTSPLIMSHAGTGVSLIYLDTTSPTQCLNLGWQPVLSFQSREVEQQAPGAAR